MESPWTVVELDGELFEIRPYKKPRQPRVPKTAQTAMAIEKNQKFLERVINRAQEIFYKEGYKDAGVAWKQCVKLAGEQLKGRLNEQNFF